MKSDKMAPGMNDKPFAGEDAAPPASDSSKLADFISGLSPDECMELQELLEEKLGTDLDNDNEEGEPNAHAEKVLGDTDLASFEE